MTATLPEQDHPCPKCGEMIGLDPYIGHGHVAEPGDVAICPACAEVSVLDDDLRPVPPDEETYIELMTNKELQRIVASVLLFIEARNDVMEERRNQERKTRGGGRKGGDVEGTSS